jgi:flagellar biosynthesis component FlhA
VKQNMSNNKSEKPSMPLVDLFLMFIIGLVLVVVFAIAVAMPATLLDGGIVTWVVVGLLTSTGTLILLKKNSTYPPTS